MKKAYVIGTNVRKSLSPLIFNHWFKKYKICAVYEYKTIKKENFHKEIKKLLKEKNLCGINITIPFKEKITKTTHKLDKHSKKIGAANCVTVKNNRYIGSNTDWIGFNNALLNKCKNKKKISSGKTIVIGYGGAAKAVLYGLGKISNNFKKNTFVFNRSTKKINQQLVNQKKTISLKKITKHLDDASLIINTIPKNILKELKLKKIEKKTIVCDIVYKPKETGFIKHFKKTNTKIYGINMLINQAKPCFFEWFGIMPKEDRALSEKILKQITR